MPLQKEWYTADEPQMIGSGGTFSFRFAPDVFAAGGTFKLSFVYIRPWESQALKTVSVTLVVEK